MASKLGKSLNQKTYPGAGDFDDCWVVSAIQAKRAVAGGTLGKPSITTFRALAGVPDKPGPTGGTREDIIRGCNGCWPDLEVKASSPVWETFLAALVKNGNVASLAVRSGELPIGIRYGFMGDHQITVDYADGTLWEVNPLQPEGTDPRPIAGYQLKRAALAFDFGGRVSAVLFKPQTPIIEPGPPEPGPLPDDTTPYSQVDVDRAVLEAIQADRAKARIVYE